MPSRILRTDGERADWLRFLTAQPLPMTVSQIKGENRSQQQNRTLHMWFGQVSQETGDEAWEVKGYCKAKFGLPIMKRDNPEWVAEYEPLYMPLPYPLRIKFFSFVPMTSKMKVQQMTEIMDAVQRHYTQQGIALRDPEALKYETQHI